MWPCKETEADVNKAGHGRRGYLLLWRGVLACFTSPETVFSELKEGAGGLLMTTGGRYTREQRCGSWL